MGVHRTCRWAGEIELTPIGAKLNGSWRVPLHLLEVDLGDGPARKPSGGGRGRERPQAGVAHMGT